MNVSTYTNLPDTPHMELVREKYNELGELLQESGAGRRMSLALTNLETSSMYAIKAMTIGDD